MHFTSDRVRSLGHEVELWFAEDLPQPLSRPFHQLLRPVQVYRRILHALKAGARFDAIDIHEPIAGAYASGRARNRRLPPLIVCVYGTEARAIRARDRYTRLRGGKVPWRSRATGLYHAWKSAHAFRLADRITIETTEDRDYLVKELGVPRGRVGFLHGGVSSVFFSCSPETPRDPDSVLFLGTWIERKGVLDLVSAMRIVWETKPGTRLTIAGCGQDVAAVLRDFPEANRNRVRVIPRVTTDEESIRLYASHAVFAFPSTFEGQPLVLLEAAAARMAIVTTSTCGMKDFIRDGENGRIVPIAAPADLARVITGLLDDPEQARRLGQRASEEAKQFTWDRSAEQLVATVKKTLTRPGP